MAAVYVCKGQEESNDLIEQVRLNTEEHDMYWSLSYEKKNLQPAPERHNGKIQVHIDSVNIETRYLSPGLQKEAACILWRIYTFPYCSYMNSVWQEKKCS